MADTMTRHDIEWMACDECDTPATEWPAGLLCEDREVSVFSGTHRTCPACTATHGWWHGMLTMLLEESIAFADITWTWIPPREVTNA